MNSSTPPHIIDALEQLDVEPADRRNYGDDPMPAAHLEPSSPQDFLSDDEAPARRQPGTVWRVEFDDSEPLEVRTTNRDLIAWERTKARHRDWPTSDEAPIFATTFVVWTAAQRQGLTALKFEAFVDLVVDLERVQDVPADPTR